MYYNYINPQTGTWCQSKYKILRFQIYIFIIKFILFNKEHASLGALGDSFYEYLLKSWVLSGKKDELARSMYENSMKVNYSIFILITNHIFILNFD